ncbi:titin homolog isoform X4 [Ostrea edulis]|uniref:titin homolog isoform X4 n=1 Tax=Ostrea edulis TaxID=37623 RepID=UPI0024AF2972|nr:titin homolog isoform X4 [Ostrea edulis]
MSSEENQCNEINCDEPKVNGFSSTADEIKGHSENQVKGQEVMGSGGKKCAKRQSRDLICDEDVISANMNSLGGNGILSRAAEDVHKEQREEEDEFPLGSEALSLTVERSTPNKQPVDKRLGWLLSDSANTSIGSDFSHNSDISLDMLLSERSRDPEEILTNLGFVDQSEDTETDDLQRLPERFLEQPSSAKGIDVGALDVNRLLNLSAHEEMLEQINTSKMNAEFAEQGHPQLGNVLASVMNGMKFLNAINQSHNPSGNSSFDSRHSDDSVLQHPKNREFLDKQGFYKRHEKKVSKTETAALPSQSRLDRSQSLDASEKRKQFHQMRSRNFSTQPLESDESNLSEEKFQSRDSRDSSLFKSVTSMEYSDSFESTEGREDSLEKRNQMGMLGVHSDDDWDMVRPAVSLGDISKSLISKKVETEKETSVKDELIEAQAKEAESAPTGFMSAAYSAGLQKLQEMRKSLVEKSMASCDLDDDYEVTSPPLSKQSSLESTLTAKEFRMKTSSSCTPKNESLDTEDQVDSVFTVEDTEKLPQIKSPGHVSFSDLKIPELVLNAGPFSVSDKDLLGGMGRMESIQSDSSGFAEGDMGTDHHREAEERVSSLGSSAESDQTSKSNVTVIASHSQQNLQRKLCVGKDKMRSKVEKVDVAVGTEDIHQSVDSGIEQSSPSITYHFKQKEEGVTSAEEVVDDGSVVLTIQLPKDWLNDQGRSTTSTVSHLYKHIGISSQAVSPANKSASHADIQTGSTSKSHTQLEKIQTDPTRSDTMRSHLNPRWASTPSIVFTHKQSNKPYDSSSQRYSKKKLFTRAPLRENGLGGSVGEPSVDKTDSELSSSFDKDSECSFISNTDSYSSLRDENVEYVKLVRLVNKPMSFKILFDLQSSNFVS